MIDITEEEAAQYDRQIRLWGLESQKRLRGSSVLLIGLRGLGAEVAKNVILAGVKSITLMDRKVLTTCDTYSQFLAPQECKNENRAKSSQTRAQILNPMVDVKVDETDPKHKPDEFYRNFDVIVATDCNLSLLFRLNNICRKYLIKFYCADVFGLYGYIFADLQNHTYAEEVTVKSKDKKEEKKMTVKKKVDFCSLKSALKVNWTEDKYAKMLRKMDSTVFIINLLLKFRLKVGRNPSPAEIIQDSKVLKDLLEKDERLTKLPPNVQIKDEELNMVFSQLSPVCAIVGGVLGQEIIKALSQHGEPHNNFFVFNANNISGRVLHLQS